MPKIDESRIGLDSGRWKLVHETPYTRTWEMELDDNHIIRRTESLVEEALLEQNRQSYNDSDGKRWGDGKIVGRIPLNMFYNEKTQLAEKIREGDVEHAKWWLNHYDNRPFRTFKGKV